MPRNKAMSSALLIIVPRPHPNFKAMVSTGHAVLWSIVSPAARINCSAHGNDLSGFQQN